MDLVLDNRRVVFEGRRPFTDVLDQRTSFRVKGFMFSNAWKLGFWDGREHLLKRWEPKKRDGWWSLPAGLLGELLAVAKVHGIEFTVHDQRRQPGSTIEGLRWNPSIVLRPYQEQAVEAALADRGLETGKVLLDMATRSGKTVVAAAIIHRLKLRTLFIAPSKMLLGQTIDSFRNTLGIRPGVIGGGAWEPGPVTVATIQTLSRNLDTLSTELFSAFDAIFFDEAHHAQADDWRETLMRFDSFYKIGLSATIFLHRKKETPKGTIWLRGACGPVVAKVTPSELIAGGYLVQPIVRIHRIVEPRVPLEGDWNTVYEAGIVRHPTRNAKIVELAKERVAAGLQTVIVASRLPHVSLLADALEAEGVSTRVIVGETSDSERKAILTPFRAGKLKAIVGTVIGEGVDLPEIGSVIVAEAGESNVRATQRFRNITPADGKTTAILDDFADMHHPVLAKHALARVKLYRSHSGFKVEAA